MTWLATIKIHHLVDMSFSGCIFDETLINHDSFGTLSDDRLIANSLSPLRRVVWQRKGSVNLVYVVMNNIDSKITAK